MLGALAPIWAVLAEAELDRDHQPGGLELAPHLGTGDAIFNQEAAETVPSRLADGGPAMFAPDQRELLFAAPFNDLPPEANPAPRLAEGTIFGGVGGEFVQHQAERGCDLRRQLDVRALQFHPGGHAGEVFARQ